MPFAGSLATADAIRLGNDLNHPLRIVGTDTHPGHLPPEAGFASVSPSNAILCGFKKAEEEEGVVLRLFESEGRRTTARIRLDREMLGRAASVVETDLLERPVPKSTARVTADGISVVLPKRGIATVLVKLRK
jgi:alpha-mannosidase